MALDSTIKPPHPLPKIIPFLESAVRLPAEGETKCFVYNGTETIPLAKDIQELWDIIGTVSLLSLRYVRKL